LDARSCAQNTAHLNGTLFVNAFRGARGGNRSIISLSAILQGPTLAASDSISFPIRVEFGGEFDMNLLSKDPHVTLAPGATRTLDVTLFDLGNADERIIFNASPTMNGLRVATPPPLFLYLASHENVTTQLTIIAGEVTGTQRVNVTAASSFLDDPSQAGVVHSILLSIYVTANATPAPGVAASLLLIAGLALARRRS
jgi:hypothetical protein